MPGYIQAVAKTMCGGEEKLQDMIDKGWAKIETTSSTPMVYFARVSTFTTKETIESHKTSTSKPCTGDMDVDFNYVCKHMNWGFDAKDFAFKLRCRVKGIGYKVKGIG